MPIRTRAQASASARIAEGAWQRRTAGWRARPREPGRWPPARGSVSSLTSSPFTITAHRLVKCLLQGPSPSIAALGPNRPLRRSIPGGGDAVQRTIRIRPAPAISMAAAPSDCGRTGRAAFAAATADLPYLRVGRNRRTTPPFLATQSNPVPPAGLACVRRLELQPVGPRRSGRFRTAARSVPDSTGCPLQPRKASGLKIRVIPDLGRGPLQTP